jgi:hypothetical protein
VTSGDLKMKVHATFATERSARAAAEELYKGGQAASVQRVRHLHYLGIETPRTTNPWAVIVDA